LKHWIFPVAGAITLLVAWQLVVTVFGVPHYLVPTPVAVFDDLIRERALIASNAVPTALESILGFLLGNGAAVVVAILFVANRYLRLTYFPIVLFFNTIPILALAPIVVLIFGLGMFPKVVVAAIVCFFPTLVNMIRGLESPTASELDIVHSLCATRLQIFWHLRLPRSVPYLFAALRIAAQTSVIGALVGEWIGTNKGLGALIIESTFNYHAERLYAAVFVSSLLAIVFFTIVSAAERRFSRFSTAH
jgi:NitT/TauT family transport system permease protein